LPVVLYGCETWCLTLRGEYRLRDLDNGVLRKIFGLKREAVTGNRRRMHNNELHDTYSSPNVIRVTEWWMRLAAGVAYMRGFGGETWRKKTTAKT
jgi:hypothetical protein